VVDYACGFEWIYLCGTVDHKCHLITRVVSFWKENVAVKVRHPVGIEEIANLLPDSMAF
jgi:hypothetical protein